MKQAGPMKVSLPRKITENLKEAIRVAAANAGDDIAQKKIDTSFEESRELIEVNGGLVGYLEYVATHETKSFVPLLGKVLPLVVNADVDIAAKERAQREAEHFTKQLEQLAHRYGSSN